MNVYVETNFVLELTFEQEQCESCEQILQFCEARQAKLIIPAYSLAEPHEKLRRQASSRGKLQELLDKELRQLSRTASYTSQIEGFQAITDLLVRSNEEEQRRFMQYRERILNICDAIALTADIITEAASYEITDGLAPQDAIVYASVINHLRRQQQQACFLNRNARDFNSPDIKARLKQFNCRLITEFGDGYEFIRSQSSSYQAEE